MTTRIFLMSIFILTFISSGIAQDNADAVLKNIQDKFNSITDLSAQITQTVNGKVNLKGKVFYKKD
ncbi:MAG TPA: hypothetical protein VIZ21_00255, partial [Ignavibacteriaceae bacterium]